jgi:hypothetical protein
VPEKPFAAYRLNAASFAGPRFAEGKSGSPLKTDLYATPDHRLRIPPEAKANFVQPQSAQQQIGFVPSFCPTAP